MSQKRPNALRQYHLLITRGHEGFRWQIRYGRNAKPLTSSPHSYANQLDAKVAGERMLAQVAVEPDPVEDPDG